MKTPRLLDVCPTRPGPVALLFFFVFVRFALRFRVLGGGGGRFGFLEKLGFLLLHGVGFLRQRGHAFVIAEVAEVLAVDRLVDEQIFRERDEHVGVGTEDLLALERGLVKDVLDLFVDDGGGLFGIALRLAEVTADEDAVARGIEADGAETVAHGRTR